MTTYPTSNLDYGGGVGGGNHPLIDAADLAADPAFTAQYQPLGALVEHGDMGAAETIDLAGGNLHSGTLTADCVVTLSNTGADPAGAMIIFKQGGSGGYSPTFSPAVDWIDGAAPTWQSTAGFEDVLRVVSTGDRWLMEHVGTSFNAAGFDPVALVSWHAVYWAGSPDWTPPTDAANVSQWDDVSGNARHALQATGTLQPSFTASAPSLNDKPAIFFAGGDEFLRSADWTSITGPSEMFVVVNALAVSGRTVFNGNDASNRRALSVNASPQWSIQASATPAVAGTPTVGAHALHVTFDGSTGADTLTVDGNLIINANAGGEAMDGITIGANTAGTAPWQGSIAFLGVFNGTLTAGQRSALLSWARGHYGTP